MLRLTRSRVAATLLAVALGLASGAVAPAAAAPTAPPASRATPGSLELAILAPLTTPPSVEALIDAETLAEYTAPDGLLTAQLDAYAGRPVALALDPRILASIRLLGSTAPASATAWLARLASGPNEIFLLTFGDADPAALASLDALDLTDPADLDAFIDPARFGPPVTPPPSPAPTASDAPTASPAASATAGPTAQPDPGAPPPLPTPAELVAWSGSLGDLAWPLEGSVTADELAALADAGVERVVLDGAQLPEARDAVAAVRGSGTTALVASTRLSDLSRAVVSLPEADAAASVEELRSELEARTTAGGSGFLTLGRHWPLGELHVDALIRVLRDQPGVTLTAASTLLARPAEAATLSAPTVDTTDRDALLGELLRERTALLRFATVADEPALLTAPDRMRLLALAAVGWQVAAADWPAAVDAELSDSAETRSSVHVVQGSDLLVLSPSTGIPITVSNALDVPVTVVVSARPMRPLLTIDPTPVTLEVAPESSNRVYLPAQAVTNGVVPVRVTVTSTAGVPIGPVTTVRVDLQAQWETVGIVLGIVLVLVFVGGIVRNVVRRRREGRSEGEADSDDEAPPREGARPDESDGGTPS